VALHPYAVAENCAACVRARRINRDNSNAIPLRSIAGSQAIDERALPCSGSARHSNHKGPPGVWKNPLQEIFRLRVVVFDRRDRAGNGADVSGAYLLGPRFDGCGHRIWWRRRPAGDFSSHHSPQKRRRDAGATRPTASNSLQGVAAEF
jgi:hypothetical protein